MASPTAPTPAGTYDDIDPTEKVEPEGEGLVRRVRRAIRLPKKIPWSITLKNASITYSVRYRVEHLDAPHPVGGSRSRETAMSASVDANALPAANMTASRTGSNSTDFEYRDELLMNVTLKPTSGNEIALQEVDIPYKARVRVRGYLVPSGVEFKNKVYSSEGSNLILTATDKRLDAVADAPKVSVDEQTTAYRCVCVSSHVGDGALTAVCFERYNQIKDGTSPHWRQFVIPPIYYCFVVYPTGPHPPPTTSLS